MNEQILGLTAPLMAYVFSAVFVALWWRGRLGKHVLAFGAAYALFATGFLVTHILPTGSAYVFYATQAFYSASAILLIWGTCSRAGRPAFLGVNAAIYGVAFCALTAAVLLSNDAGPRLIILNAGYGAMFLVALVSLLGARRRSFIDTAILWIVALHTIDFMVRPMITVLAEGAIPVGDYRQSNYYSIINIVLMVKTLNTAIVLIGASIFDLMQAFRDRADTDGLTGLRNRTAFETAIAGPIANAAQAREQVSLVIVDIDHFKQVNDLWGHQAGDEVIASFAGLLQQMIRDDDIAGRIGGEEFCLLIRECSPLDTIRLADRIRMAFAQMIHPAIGENMRLTASFGVAHLRGRENYHELFGRADAALYRAKGGGRNRVESEDQANQAPAVMKCAAAA
ncbi:GGDEF domain-containing protein [Aurantiacibacter marinus]|uniref:diguanylate cyclase n=1 Tax=Aurantiacibacter marinus TaxID=874156 RepID=A0A0H0XMC0_9SPHN|nr:sensor domain-containing diguanylate cyclase [Aurantiacibacter marinus]KLI63166.1 hypothetical protein AAV99_10790 [Aurantiacibacter marinus]